METATAKQWRQYSIIPCWTPLSSIKIEDGNKLNEDIYRISKNIYFFTVDRNLAGARGCYVTYLLWSESDGAAKRAFSWELESDEINKSRLFPSDLFEFSSGTNYGALIECVKKSENYFPFTETSVYRIAIDGAFVCRELSIHNWKFKFREEKSSIADCPFAISYELK